MNKVYKKVPKKLTQIELGRGAYGRCFLVDDRVFKLYYDNERDIYPNIERLSLIQSSHFEFPKELVFLKEISELTFIGYFMNYIEGDHFNAIDGKTNMNKFISALCRLENEIKRLTLEYRMKMFDLTFDNTFLTKDDEIKVIDTDLYTFSDCLDDDKLLLNNMSELSSLISEDFIKVNERRFASPRLRKYLYDFYDGSISPSTYLYEIMEEIRKITREDVADYNSFETGINLLLKK